MQNLPGVPQVSRPRAKPLAEYMPPASKRALKGSLHNPGAAQSTQPANHL